MKQKFTPQFGFFNPRVLGILALFATGVLLALVVLGVYPGSSTLAQPPGGSTAAPPSSGEELAQTGVVYPEVSTGPIYSQIPELTPEQLAEQENELREVIHLPTLPGERRNAPPVDPPTERALDQPERAISDPKTGPEGANDFVYKTIHDLTPSEASSSRSVIGEPSIANMGSTVFYTGNWFAARSTNAGQSFSYVNPYTTFPSINNGFCCDQVTNYVPNHNMMVWALQYVKDSTSGTLRIARAVGEAAVANNTWVRYDFNPQLFGFATNNWFDFPSMTVSDNYLYVTSNVFTTANNTFSGCVIWRILLSELAAGGPIFHSSLRRTDVNSLRCTEGARTTMYWGALLSSSQVRIHRWDDSSGTVFWDDVNVNSYIPLDRDGVATSPDGTNWAARADSRILGSWVAGGVIGLMWPAKQGGSFPFPYSIIARFSQSNRALISQTQIWNSQFAWLYPTASVNSAGNLAGFFSYGGGPHYPGANIWISDDVQNGFPPALYGATTSNIGPSTNAWGDYHTVRRHRNSPNTWAGSVHYLRDTASNVVPRYLWFGRERDFVTKPDFNIDGYSDILWQNNGTGERRIWLMNGSQPPVSNFLAMVDPQWQMTGTGDFDRNGQVDILWQHTGTGERRIWLMNGLQPLASNFLATVDPQWQMTGTGDFDRDGQVDILWQHTGTGERRIWLMNGLQPRSSNFLATVATQWQMTGTGDFDRDEQVDILWQHTGTGERRIWLMDGLQPRVSNFLATVLPTEWDIRNF